MAANKEAKLNCILLKLLRIPLIRKPSIRTKIIIAIVLVILLPMSIAGFYFYTTISSILVRNAYNSLDQLIKQANENIGSSFELVKNTSLFFISSKSIRTNIFNMDANTDRYNLFLNKNDIEADMRYSLMFNNAWNTNLISTIYLFFNETAYCSIIRTSPNLTVIDNNNIAIYRSVLNDPDKEGIILPPTYSDRTIYFVKKIYNLDSFKLIGILIVGMDENTIFQKYKALLEYPDAKAFVFDNNGTVFSHSDKSMLGGKIGREFLEPADYAGVKTMILNQKEYYFVAEKISDSSLTFSVGVPKNQVLSNLTRSLHTYLIIILIIIIISIYLSVLISLWITRFIRDLLNNMNKVKTGDYNAKMHAYTDSQLNLISATFNKMTDEIQHLISEVYEKRLLLKDAQFRFLQSQMNPHFLFNTLVTISYKARLSNDGTVYKMVTSLTELLQAGIYSNVREKVTIRQELEFVRFYLYLQKERFDDKLEYHINVTDESILDYFLPKLCIEPIVENAVVHGIEGKIGKGKVEITIRKASDSIYFEILDDGIGFVVDHSNQDRDKSTIKVKKNHHSIGLSNTDKRIKLIYGEQYGIMISSEPGKGTRVIIHIPVDREDTTHV